MHMTDAQQILDALLVQITEQGDFIQLVSDLLKCQLAGFELTGPDTDENGLSTAIYDENTKRSSHDRPGPGNTKPTRGWESDAGDTTKTNSGNSERPQGKTVANAQSFVLSMDSAAPRRNRSQALMDILGARDDTAEKFSSAGRGRVPPGSPAQRTVSQLSYFTPESHTCPPAHHPNQPARFQLISLHNPSSSSFRTIVPQLLSFTFIVEFARTPDTSSSTSLSLPPPLPSSYNHNGRRNASDPCLSCCRASRSSLQSPESRLQLRIQRNNVEAQRDLLDQHRL
ncbi:hypothetical protein IWZ00DRAFT_486995 [Phyllosticta capitalensis]|uniref:Uncharacterized protein n=1 Tax=Phyllosticta capitalensis TaxID=121624 RepID=A0ABR1YTR5_9PEZI